MPHAVVMLNCRLVGTTAGTSTFTISRNFWCPWGLRDRPAGFKIQYSQECVGSSPTSGTWLHCNAAFSFAPLILAAIGPYQIGLAALQLLNPSRRPADRFFIDLARSRRNL
jgi:hypothetical protein